MFSKNNTTMNNKKQYEKVNHYGIKKFNAGTASVLIASAFMFLGGAAQAADTNKQEATVAATEKVTATEEKVETAKVETPAVAPKAEVKEEKTENFRWVRGDVVVDFLEYKGYLHGSDVDLKPKEVELLKMLVENPKIVLRREQILEELWDDDFPYDRVVDVYIKNLRKKFIYAIIRNVF